MDRLTFTGVIQKEFNVKFEPENCADLQSLADLIQFLEDNAV